MQRDPLGVTAGPSLYEYCLSRPGALVDPLGEEPEPAQKSAEQETVEKALKEIAEYGPEWAQQLLKDHPELLVQPNPKLRVEEIDAPLGVTRGGVTRCPQDENGDYVFKEILIGPHVVKQGGDKLIEVLLHELRHLMEHYKVAPKASGMGHHPVPESNMRTLPDDMDPREKERIGARDWEQTDVWERIALRERQRKAAEEKRLREERQREYERLKREAEARAKEKDGKGSGGGGGDARKK